MKKIRLTFLLVASFAITFNLNSVFAATISQSTIDLIDRDLKDPKTSHRDFTKEIAELNSTIEDKDASPVLKATCYRLLSGIKSDVMDMSQAKTFIQKAVELDPTNKDILVQRAFAHTLDADREKVAEYYKEAIAAHPELSWLYFNHGGVLQSLERHKEAIEDFEKAASLSKRDQKSLAYFLEVDSQIAMSDFKGVIETAKKVSVENVNLPAAVKLNFFKSLGYSQLREDLFDEGIKNISQALELASTDKEKATLHHFRSIGYYKLDQKEKADEERDLAEKFGYRAPNSPPPDRVAQSGEELNNAIKPLIEQARSSLPDAKKRYLKGLPANHFMSVTTMLVDKNGHHEQVFVNVSSWDGDVVNGTLANDVKLEGFKKRQLLKVNEKDIRDWTIVNEKGEEEGNLIGKFIDKWLDEQKQK